MLPIGGMLFFFAVQNIGVGIPTPITSTNPIMVPIIGVMIGIESLTRKQFIGIMARVIRTVIIVIRFVLP